MDTIESSIGKEGCIELPVIHEQTTKPCQTEKKETLAVTKQEDEPKVKQDAAKPVPNFKTSKFTQFKATKWEPTTDSDVSDLEVVSKGPSRYYGERKETYCKFKPVQTELSPSRSPYSQSPRNSISAAANRALLGT